MRRFSFIRCSLSEENFYDDVIRRIEGEIRFQERQLISHFELLASAQATLEQPDPDPDPDQQQRVSSMKQKVDESLDQIQKMRESLAMFQGKRDTARSL